MNINGKDINIDDLFDQKYMHKEIKKGIFLSQYQCEVLQRYNINPYECSSINELIFMIDEVLEDVSKVLMNTPGTMTTSFMTNRLKHSLSD